MDKIRQRLEHDLHAAMARLRSPEGAVAVEELPRSIGSNRALADEVDEIQASEQREIGFATRELLVGRVNALSAALDRLAEGRYGTCVECEEPISVARLRALPEVRTCIRCQDRLEHSGRPFAREGVEPELDEV
jgi:RNA polymerase-binding transcription factor